MKTASNRQCSPIMLALLVTAGVAFAAHPAAAQGNQPPPPNLGVTVLNVPIPVTQSGTWSVTLAGTPLVEVAQTPVSESVAPTCDAVNRCFVQFPAVPEGYRLRVTRLHGALFFQTADAFVALDRDNLNTTLFLAPIVRFPAAYNGTVLSFNIDTDFVFGPGQRPIVEVGTAGTFGSSSFNRLGLTGEFVRVPE